MGKSIRVLRHFRVGTLSPVGTLFLGKPISRRNTFQCDGAIKSTHGPLPPLSRKETGWEKQVKLNPAIKIHRRQLPASYDKTPRAAPIKWQNAKPRAMIEV